MVEGGTVDGIGHALYSGLTFKDGVPEQTNFDKYRLIRHREALKEIEILFIDNGVESASFDEIPIFVYFERCGYCLVRMLFYDLQYV